MSPRRLQGSHRYHVFMSSCTAPVRGHRTASARAACPACGGRFASRGYSSGGGGSSYAPSSRGSRFGSGGGTRSTVGRPVPSIQSLRPQIQQIAENSAASRPTAGHVDATNVTYDVFISHAWEDKDTVVRDLARALQEHGLSVWYDEFVLRVGDSLRRAIDRGIANSRFGIVVLSEAFFRKQWTQYELDGLVHMSMHEQRKQVCLPIWHKISVNEVTANSPSLANVMALRTSDYSISQIAAEIAAVVRPAGS